MSWWLVGLLVLVAAQAALVPAVIGLLPEPAATPRPVPTPESLPAGAVPGRDGVRAPSGLDPVLREEGPKEPYAAIARLPYLVPVCVVISLALAYAVAERLGNHPVGWVVGLLTPTLVLLSVVDWRTRLLPRVVVLPATGVLIALMLVEWAIVRDTHVLVRTLAGMLLARSFFWLLWSIRRGGMGFGDVRLAAVVGIVLGRVSWNAWIVGLYGGLLVFSLYGIGLALARRDVTTLKRHLPYGPFMVLGLYLGILAGNAVTII